MCCAPRSAQLYTSQYFVPSIRSAVDRPPLNGVRKVESEMKSERMKERERERMNIHICTYVEKTGKKNPRTRDFGDITYNIIDKKRAQVD